MDRLYHLSANNLDRKILQPRIPNNFLVKNGYEDDTTKRVCFTSSIDKSLRAMSQNLTGKELYVHIPYKKYDTYKPTVKEVPDVKVTGEIWIKEPVKLKCIGKIKVIKDRGEDGLPYKYGNHIAELYDWDWKWINKVNESLNIHEFYNELRAELESNTDGFFMIKPSKDKEKLDSDFQKFNAQNDDQKRKSDIRSFALYGMNNYDHYHILLSKIKKGTKDDEIDGLEYNPHDGIVKEEASEYYFSNTADGLEFEHNIEYAKDFNMHTTGRVIIYPTRDQNELESLYMKYMALDTNSRASSDNKARKLFNADNRQIYNYCKEKLIKSKNDETEGNHKVEDETIDKQEEKETSLYSNDLPILSPTDFQTKVEENYKCFSKEDGEKIKVWREAYSLLGHGIKIPEYNKYNLDRINILRKAIYENNDEAIVQCGWIPEIEFNSENRAKASKLVRDKMDAMTYSIKAYNDYIEEFMILNKNDLYWKFDDFESGKSNILLITGLSGSGKSTLGKQLSKKYKAEYIELDCISDVIKNNRPYILQKWMNTLSSEELKDLYKDPFEGEFQPSFLNFCINYAKNNKDKKFIIEGIQIYELFKDKARNYPLIIKGTSVLKSFYQKSVKREKWDYKTFLKYSKDDLSWLIRSDKDLDELKKSIKESYIEESSDKSYLDKNHKQNGQKRLSDFKFSKTKNNDDGESYNLFWKDDNDKVVGKVTVDTIPASDGYRWFGSLEVSNKYRGYGLGKQILDIAVNKYKAGALAVYKDNEIAYKMYKNYGFKESTDRKSKDYYYMYLERNKDKSIKESKIVKPEKCTKCGSTNIGVFIQGEPIFKCKDCGEYLGTVPVSMNESNTTNTNKKAVSIVLVSGNSWLGKTIKKVQGNEFSHASISLDDDLKRIYSFNRRNGFNGLSYESMKQYTKDGVDKVGVYTFLVTDSAYKQLEKTLDNFNLFINKTKYSILNLLTIPLNIPLDMDMKLVCSEFVDKLLKSASLDLTNKKSMFVSPKDFSDKVKNNTKIVEVFKGNPKDFNPSIIKKKIEKLKRSKLAVYEFVDYDDEVITEAKSFPIQFDKDGNLLLKNIKRIDFEQEYTNSHRLLMEYDKQESYDPMKFELAKMQFFITLLEKKIYKQGKDKSVKELKVRARFLNDFKKYLKIVVSNDKTFNFTQYYEQSPFNDAIIQIDKNTLKFGWEALKYLIK